MLSRAFLTKPRTLLLASSSALALAYFAPSLSATLGSSPSRQMSSRATDFPIQKSEEEWRMQLSKEQFRVRLSSPFEIFLKLLTSFCSTGP
jgi:hypothetical protein